MTVGTQLLELIRLHPGITAAELAAKADKIPSHIYNECGALENTGRIKADRSARPYRYYAAEDAPASTLEPEAPAAEASPYVSEFREIIESVTSAAGRKIGSGYEIIDRGMPHVPRTLKRGTMGVYSFLYNDEFLKIGKAGPNSNARFFSQHYLPASSASNLSKSLLNDSEMKGLGITGDNVGDWIRQNTRRIDIILDESLGIFTLELIEAALHFKYEPRYEGFKNQR